jgi:hypothetical protein
MTATARPRAIAVPSADAPVDVMIVLQGLNLVQAAADLLFSRVFKAFPGIQFSLTEGGIGWVPYFQERAADVDTALRSSGRPIVVRTGPVSVADVQQVATA